jgi:hypothetical protein
LKDIFHTRVFFSVDFALMDDPFIESVVANANTVSLRSYRKAPFSPAIIERMLSVHVRQLFELPSRYLGMIIGEVQFFPAQLEQPLSAFPRRSEYVLNMFFYRTSLRVYNLSDLTVALALN